MNASKSFWTLFALTAILAIPADKVNAAPPSHGIVEGYVVDLNGNPVEGATVHVAVARDGQLVKRFETDRTGTFQARLEFGTYEARAGKDFFPSAREMFTIRAGETTRIRLVLQERPAPSTGFLKGQILDAHGNPAGPAKVYVQSSQTGEVVARLDTDRNGEFKLELKPGSYILTAGMNELPDVTLKFEIVAGESTELKIVLVS